MGLIGAPIDFLGLNYYRPHHIRRGDWSELRAGETPVPEVPGFVEYLPPELPRTVMDWLVEPDALYELLTRLHGES
jgi:beta-glucosidase